ncbi:aminotransferase class IV, partial [Pseudonocardia ailaonensis]|uniref:aminotransferase class IV n=1 Tax=Pseudonocardia ailaonensis TaxID=367279 RepID=UPI0031E12A2E
TRAAVGGTGTAKCGGNYAASLLPQAQAAEHGCAQVAYLDAAEKKWIEEMGGMNMFFVLGGTELLTPELSGSILEGVTRHSLLVLGKEIGCQVSERRISAEEWITGCADGSITEVFACGTAAVITPIGSVKYAHGDTVEQVRVADGEPGPITTRLRELLTDIQRGTGHDSHGWMTTL